VRHSEDGRQGLAPAAAARTPVRRSLFGSRGSVVKAPSSAGTTHSSRSLSPRPSVRLCGRQVGPSPARIVAAVDSTSSVPRGTRGSHHSELRLASPQRTGRTLGTAGGADRAHNRARPADTIRNRRSARFSSAVSVVCGRAEGGSGRLHAWPVLLTGARFVVCRQARVSAACLAARCRPRGSRPYRRGSRERGRWVLHPGALPTRPGWRARSVSGG
jgi:hypothetical protein